MIPGPFFGGAFFNGGFFGGFVVAVELAFLKLRTFTERRRF
jgi:hypothetical protein